MMRQTIREYGRLTTRPVASSLHEAQIPATAFDWLCRLCEQEPTLGQLRNQTTLQWKSFVGVLRTPCGLELEIVPKTQQEAATAKDCREYLVRMLSKVLDISFQKLGEADIRLFSLPLTEWVARQFLLRLHRLLRHGLRCEYQRVEEEQTCLRGQLDVRRQVCQLPHRRHLFHVRHDVFNLDRPENRLLQSALRVVAATVRDAENWRLAAAARPLLADIPPSRDIQGDFAFWRHDRLMAAYGAVRPWCELVLGNGMPYAIAGQQTGISLLFPMHDLFERYVALSLRERLVPGAQLETQPVRFLCSQEGRGSFVLRPDIVVHYEGRKWILDTKWKLLDCEKAEHGICIQDIYQIYTYGQQWLAGQGGGDVLLVYPGHAAFPDSVPPLHYRNSSLKLTVAAFDLATDALLCTPDAATLLPWLKQTPPQRQGA